MSIDKDTERVLAATLDKLDLDRERVSYSPGTDNGGNFFGLIVKAEVEGRDRRTGTPRDVTVVVKHAPRGAAYRTFVHVNRIFAREAYIYERVFPAFVDLQKSAYENLTDKPPIYCPVPEFYHSETDKPGQEVLVMRDVRTQGFAALDRRQALTLEIVSFIIRDIGRMHALSLALRDRRPDVFDDIAKNMDEIYFNQPHDSEIHGTLRFMSNQAIHCLDPIKEADVYNKFKGYLNNMTQSAVAAVQPEPAGKYAVITHGDFWVNNLLYKFKNSTQLSEICMLDWQMARLGSPALDLAYFLFLCADGHILEHHYDYLLHEYHDSLCAFLVQLGCTADLFPFDELVDQMRRFSVYALYMGTWVLSVLTSEADEIPDMDNIDRADSIMKIFQYEKRSVDKFHQRVRPVILHMARHHCKF